MTETVDRVELPASILVTVEKGVRKAPENKMLLEKRRQKAGWADSEQLTSNNAEKFKRQSFQNKRKGAKAIWTRGAPAKGRPSKRPFSRSAEKGGGDYLTKFWFGRTNYRLIVKLMVLIKVQGKVSGKPQRAKGRLSYPA